MRSPEEALLLISAPLGNLADFPLGRRRLERIAASSDDLAKRVLRFKTSRGDIGLRFGAGRSALDGDVIYADAAVVIALDVAPDDVLVCRPRSIAQALGLGHALGNRHLPVQIDGEVLVLRYDRLAEDLLIDSNVEYVRESRKLGAPFRHANAPHGHA